MSLTGDTARRRKLNTNFNGRPTTQTDPYETSRDPNSSFDTTTDATDFYKVGYRTKNLKVRVVGLGQVPVLVLALLVRLLNALTTLTYFSPDEYWQGWEVAHRMVYGYPFFFFFELGGFIDNCFSCDWKCRLLNGVGSLFILYLIDIKAAQIKLVKGVCVLRPLTRCKLRTWLVFLLKILLGTPSLPGKKLKICWLGSCYILKGLNPIFRFYLPFNV